MLRDADRSMLKPVMTDVARRAGVSQKTVSRVINNAPNVSADVRARVTGAIEAVGYRPNSAARALVTRRTRVIGIVTSGTALYGPSAQLFGVERAAWQAGYSVVIVSTADSSGEEFRVAINRLIDHGVDGVVLAGPIPVALDSDVFRGVPAISVGDPDRGVVVQDALQDRVPARALDQSDDRRGVARTHDQVADSSERRNTERCWRS